MSLGLTRCSWLSDSLAAFGSLFGLSRRSRLSDFLAALVSQTLLPLSALRLSFYSRSSDFLAARTRSRPSDSLVALVPCSFGYLARQTLLRQLHEKRAKQTTTYPSLEIAPKIFVVNAVRRVEGATPSPSGSHGGHVRGRVVKSSSVHIWLTYAKQGISTTLCSPGRYLDDAVLPRTVVVRHLFHDQV